MSNCEVTIIAYYMWFAMGGQHLVLNNGKIVHYKDFMANYAELDAKGYTAEQILHILAIEPRNKKEYQIVQETLDEVIK